MRFTYCNSIVQNIRKCLNVHEKERKWIIRSIKFHLRPCGSWWRCRLQEQVAPVSLPPPLPPRQLSIPATTQSPTILSPASSPMSGTEGPQQVSVTNRTEGETMILSNQRACLYFNSWNATCTSPLNCKTYQIHQIFHDLSFIQNEQSMLPIPWYGLKIGYQGNKRKKSSEGK